jgi:hypothetical protein
MSDWQFAFISRSSVYRVLTLFFFHPIAHKKNEIDKSYKIRQKLCAKHVVRNYLSNLHDLHLFLNDTVGSAISTLNPPNSLLNGDHTFSTD